MSKILTKQQRVVNAALARWAEFANRKHWTRTKSGSLTRIYADRRVTVFGPRDDTFGWCISSTVDEVEFGERYCSVKEAMTALGEALGLSD